MDELVPAPRILRFGVSEADLTSSELRKNGSKIRLSGQPFQILCMLLERPGKLVTREELQKTPWVKRCRPSECRCRRGKLSEHRDN
jgi:DNA-binding response OmpR family regulator